MRVFVAVEINRSEILNNIKLLQSRIWKAGKVVEPHNLHFTLQFLGEVSASRVSDVAESLCRVVFEPFDVTLQGVGTFGRRKPRTVWAGTDTRGGRLLKDLALGVNASLRQLDMMPDKPFKPHLTLQRIRRYQMLEGLEEYTHTVWGTQRVDTIKLKESVLGTAGPTYSDIAEVRARE